MRKTRESRDDYKKRKEIEEARKAGTLPPEVDNEGNMINPHIPEYMSRAPWYLNQEEGAGLKHQRLTTKEDASASSLRAEDERIRSRKRRTGFRAKRYRKGACKNCGAMTHTAKDCVERPRKRGAFVTGKDIMPDETVPSSEAKKTSWDGKRDRWAGYDPSEHKKTVELYRIAERAREELRKKQKEEKRAKTKTSSEKKRKENESDDDSSSSSSSSSDEDTEEDADVRLRETEAGQFRSKDATYIKQSVRNLRIREDLPKYLRNLDPNSAHYDPKTRSMRANPTPNVPLDQLTFAGDNFVRYSGDSLKLAETQVYAWEAYKKGANVNLQADPTMAAVMQKVSKQRKEDLERRRADRVKSKYGAQDAYAAPDRSLLLGESETMVTYTRDGRRTDEVAMEKNRPVPRTKYEEDVRILNHTTVWGSYYDVEERKWGYACCHQFVKMAYCTGEAGRKAHKRSKEMARRVGEAAAITAGEDRADEEKKVAANVPANKRALYGYDEQTKATLDPEKLRDAVERQRRGGEENGTKRYHGSNVEDDVTAEDMEAYRMTKMRRDDPMAKYIAEEREREREEEEEEEERRTKKKKKKKKKKKRGR